MNRLTRCLLVLFQLVLAPSVTGIVIRDDVTDSKYRIDASEFPALVDLPGEGHGVLITPKWIVTAAHAITWQHCIEEVVINGTPREIEKLVIHPGYKKIPQRMTDEALETGDASKIEAFLITSDDIALIKLSQPVADANPVGIYRENDEQGKIVKLIGKGATGTADLGHDPKGPNRTELRRAFNIISSTQSRWLGYEFDQAPDALPLEGMSTNGDSGGPVLIEIDDQWLLAGLTSWKHAEDVDIRTFRPGTYGQTSYSIRLSHYADWIDKMISKDLSIQQSVIAESDSSSTK
ncbi:S1 family peptidase [Microbulbifer variabilis]|uniref:S1 family peptidase n=1 Tax=Microbulbifer variabilis TaxID=266805 RepID=UPI001CFD82A7|nr:trypsin-like serine protease [Microbulbifer variabilis]